MTSSVSTPTANDTGSSLSLLTLAGSYLRYWYVFILSVALALGGAYWYLQHAIPAYQVTAVMLVKDAPRSLGDEILKEGTAPAQNARIIENEIEVLKSFSLLQRAVNTDSLLVGYTKPGRFGSVRELYEKSPVFVQADTLTSAVYATPLVIHILSEQQYRLEDEAGNDLGNHAFGQPVATPTGTFRVLFNKAFFSPDEPQITARFLTPGRVAQRYKPTLKVGLLNQNSTVLKLTLEDALPERGKVVMGKILSEYRRSTLADKDLEVTNTMRFIDDRLKLITGELSNVERNVETYRRSENITDLSQEGQMFLTGISGNDTKINEIDVQLAMLNGVSSYLKNSQNGLAPAAIKDPILTDLLRKMGELQTQKEKYARTMQEDNPFMTNLNTQLASVKTSIQENVANQRQNLQLERRSLEQVNTRFSSAMRTIPRKEREYINIKRQQGIKESLYLLLLQKKEEAALTYASSLTDSRIIDAPSSPDYPLRPNPKNIYLVALLAGLVLPIGGIALRGMLSGKVTSRKDIEQTAGLPVFGEIMRKPKDLKDTIIDISNNRVIAEQFKVLRANLALDPNGNGQILLVTSSTVGEGKSFFSTNMAFNLAQLNRQVVVLEIDLRNPKTTEYLGMNNGLDRGLSTYLNGDATADEIVRPTTISPNLFLISSGPLPPNPAELLSNDNLTTLLETLRKQFDYIILDTPPIAFVADTIIMAPLADLAFYIVRQSYTPRTYMQLLSGLEAKHKFKSLHVIFNGVASPPAREAEYGYGYAVHTKLN